MESQGAFLALILFLLDILAFHLNHAWYSVSHVWFKNEDVKTSTFRNK